MSFFKKCKALIGGYKQLIVEIVRIADKVSQNIALNTSLTAYLDANGRVYGMGIDSNKDKVSKPTLLFAKQIKANDSFELSKLMPLCVQCNDGKIYILGEFKRGGFGYREFYFTNEKEGRKFLQKVQPKKYTKPKKTELINFEPNNFYCNGDDYVVTDKLRPKRLYIYKDLYSYWDGDTSEKCIMRAVDFPAPVLTVKISRMSNESSSIVVVILEDLKIFVMHNNNVHCCDGRGVMRNGHWKLPVREDKKAPKGFFALDVGNHKIVSASFSEDNLLLVTSDGKLKCFAKSDSEIKYYDVKKIVALAVARDFKKRGKIKTGHIILDTNRRVYEQRENKTGKNYVFTLIPELEHQEIVAVVHNPWPEKTIFIDKYGACYMQGSTMGTAKIIKKDFVSPLLSLKRFSDDGFLSYQPKKDGEFCEYKICYCDEVDEIKNYFVDRFKVFDLEANYCKVPTRLANVKIKTPYTKGLSYDEEQNYKSRSCDGEFSDVKVCAV